MNAPRHRIVIIGGGFGGLAVARRLGRLPADITVLDRRNFHLFQPLLYQVATGGLSPGDITSPIRRLLRGQRNVRVHLAEVTEIDAAGRRVDADTGSYPYDTLIVATGVRHHYFGHDEWARVAPGLKTVEDAIEMRRRVLYAFEAAETGDPAQRTKWLTFVVVGGGPTGVELAGALGELANDTLRRDFRAIDPSAAGIHLVEGGERILSAFPPSLSHRAAASLARLGVTVHTDTVVTDVAPDGVVVRSGDATRRISTGCVLWAAGVTASPLARSLADATGATVDAVGRIVVEPDLTLPGHPEIFVIGDLASFSHQSGTPLPGVAPVAMQQGRYVARVLQARARGAAAPPFRYIDKGTLATIGRKAAVADFQHLRVSGFVAWILWLGIHLWFLVEFENRLLVFTQWALNYFTRNRGARLISGPSLPPDAAPTTGRDQKGS